MARTLCFINYSLLCLHGKARYFHLRRASSVGDRKETASRIAPFGSSTSSMKSIRNINWVKSLKTPPFNDNDQAEEPSLSSIHQQQEAMVSILSWNILAQYLFDSTQKWYGHVDPEAPVFTWEDRFPNILDELCSYDADIICLQEVEFEAFEYDLLPSLKRVGYDGMMQKNKGKSNTRGYGISTFWKKDKFQLVDEIHRSRATVAFLEGQMSSTTNKTVLAVTNCHLEGNPIKAVTRVKQLQNVLSTMNRKRPHHHLIICGDMNCRINQSACSTYLQSGSCQNHKDEIVDWGRIVDKNDLVDIAPHSYQMQSAYPIELADKRPLDYVTYVSTPKSDTDEFVALDQIWYHTTTSTDQFDSHSVQVMGLKHPFHSPEHRRNVLKYGLPSVHNPSDHLPIGCILKFQNWNSDDLQSATKQREPAFCIKKMSEEELLRETERLMNQISFESTEQRNDFQYVTSPSSFPQIQNVRPTEEQIEELRNRRLRKKRLMDSVSNDLLRSDLEDIFRFMRAISKIRSS